MKNADMPAQAVSAESSKAVERFDCTNGGAQFCQGCYTMTSDSEGEYVRHEDYAKLEQQRAALVEALREMLATHPASFKPVSVAIDNRTDNAVRLARAALRAAGVKL